MEQTVHNALSFSSARSEARAGGFAFVALRRVLGAIWLLNAGFQAYAWLWPPRAQAAVALLHAFQKPVAGAPLSLQPYLNAVVHGVQAVGPHWVALVMVLLDLAIALSLLAGRWVVVGSWLGIVYSLFCWTTLDSFGYPYANGQTDPGVFVNYIIAFVMVIAAYNAYERHAGARAPSEDPFRTGRILFGLLWTVDAVLKWQPYFLTHFMGQLTPAAAGQPAWIAAYVGLVISVVQAIGPVPVAIVVAVVESLFAISLLSARGLRLSLPLGALYSLAVWTTAEGWGGPYTAAGTGVRGNVIGNVIIYVVVFLYLMVALSLRARRAAQ